MNFLYTELDKIAKINANKDNNTNIDTMKSIDGTVIDESKLKINSDIAALNDPNSDCTDFLYGKLNKEVEIQNYIGLSTDTSTTKVDKKFRSLSVDILRTPHRLSITSGDQAYQFDGSKDVTIDINKIEDVVTEEELANAINKAKNEIKETTDLLDSNISKESSIRLESDTILQSNINKEAKTRESKDIELNNKIDQEIKDRSNSDTEITKTITTEISNREQADKILQSNINLKLDKANADKNVITTSTVSYSGDLVKLDKTYYNMNSKVETNDSENLNLADETNAGLMSTSDVKSIKDLQSRVGNLESKTTRLLYNEKTNPTPEEINTFVTKLGYVSPFEGIAVVVDETFHIWHFYENTNIWKDDGLDTVSNFTNDLPGIILGTAKGTDDTTDGKIYAESDGTGSVIGFDKLKTNISNTDSKIQGHIDNKNNPHNVTKEQLELGNVDNTSDTDKPISKLTQDALNLKANQSDLNITNQNINKLETSKENTFDKNTAFNKNFETNIINIKANGSVSVGTSNNIARADHIHPTDTTRASQVDLITNYRRKDDSYSKQDIDNKDFATKTYVDENGGKIDTISVNKVNQSIVNKNVDITIPTKTSDLTNDGNGTSNFATEEYVDENGGKIDKIKVNSVEQSIIDKTVNIKVPTNNNELENGAGYITLKDIPEGEKGTSVTVNGIKQDTFDADTKVNTKVKDTDGSIKLISNKSNEMLTLIASDKEVDLAQPFPANSKFSSIMVTNGGTLLQALQLGENAQPTDVSMIQLLNNKIEINSKDILIASPKVNVLETLTVKDKRVLTEDDATTINTSIETLSNKAVTVESQTFNDSQKQIARTNINAIQLTDVPKGSQSQAGLLQLANDTQAAEGTSTTLVITPKQLKDEISKINALKILNTDEVIEATTETVQEVASNYVRTKYNREPANLDSLIITFTKDDVQDKVQYMYSDVSNIWINTGINSVDLTNYLQKSDIVDTLDSTDTSKVLSANQGNMLNNSITNINSTLTAQYEWLNNNKVSNETFSQEISNKADNSRVDDLSVALQNKVDKVEGMGLSSNDFTSGYINQITNNTANIENKLDKSGGTLTGEVTIGQGDGKGLQFGTNGVVNANNTTNTIFGLLGNSTLTIGHSSLKLRTRGTGARPTYNEKEIALKEDISNITIDTVLSDTSTNPVQNKVINEALNSKFSTSGGTINGAVTATGNIKGAYLIGTWLQSTSAYNGDIGASAHKIAVIRNDGWLYTRTVDSLNIPTTYIKSATKSADGKTLTLTKQDGSTVEFAGGGGSTIPYEKISSSGVINKTLNTNSIYEFTSKQITTLNLTIGTPESNKFNEYYCTFYSGSPAVKLNLNSSGVIVWDQTSPQLMFEDTFYELRVINSVASLVPYALRVPFNITYKWLDTDYTDINSLENTVKIYDTNNVEYLLQIIPDKKFICKLVNPSNLVNYVSATLNGGAYTFNSQFLPKTNNNFVINVKGKNTTITLTSNDPAISFASVRNLSKGGTVGSGGTVYVGDKLEVTLGGSGADISKLTNSGIYNLSGSGTKGIYRVTGLSPSLTYPAPPAA